MNVLPDWFIPYLIFSHAFCMWTGYLIRSHTHKPERSFRAKGKTLWRKYPPSTITKEEALEKIKEFRDNAIREGENSHNYVQGLNTAMALINSIE